MSGRMIEFILQAARNPRSDQLVSNPDFIVSVMYYLPSVQYHLARMFLMCKGDITVLLESYAHSRTLRRDFNDVWTGIIQILGDQSNEAVWRKPVDATQKRARLASFSWHYYRPESRQGEDTHEFTVTIWNTNMILTAPISNYPST